MNLNLQDKKTFQQGNKSPNYTQSSQVKNYYSELWKFEENDVDDINKLAENYYNQGNFIEAIALCHRVLRNQPNFAPAYKTLGNILQAQNKVNAAIRAYSLAIKINPKFVEAIVNLGSMFYKKGQIDEAMITYRKAINLEPNMAAAYWNLGKILEQEGRFYEAFFFQEKALEIQPDLVNNAQKNYQDSLFKKWHSQ
ncbi:tetratricopeptide repeat protein [Okeania sp. SIO1I7]|uniref:tetratricopeptide repeat protein n=1 Tax=Okeania sp. SIO1I7 TaxID=2607772 RepID=UPI0013F7957C|nr:tetratricopeptide repeat protein [Okeania sp. SIO1I7]NET24870.1 tetratricopeptide repeat protein [Okeania sp. SIO1I7]